jgi:hypothetical protein
VIEHKRLPLTLDSYELDEVYAPIGKEGERVKVIRIIVHGTNLIIRALEPELRVGRSVVLYPEIHVDERTITGFLTETPKDGSPVVLRYQGQTVARLAEPFKGTKLRRLTPGRVRRSR